MDNLAKKLKGKKNPSTKYESITNPLYMPGDGPALELTTGSPLTVEDCHNSKVVASSDCKGLNYFESAFEYGKPDSVNNRYQSIFTYEDSSNNKYKPGSKYTNFEVGTSDTEPEYSTSFYLSVTTLFSMVLVLFFPFLAWFYVKIVNQDERVLIYRLGKLTEPRGPGVVFLLPLIDKWKRISLQEQTISVSQVSGATKDGGVVEMDGNITYKIDSPSKLTNKIQNAEDTLRNHGHSCLLQLIKQFECDSMPSAAAQIGNQWKHAMNKQTATWGVIITEATVTPPVVIRAPPEPASFLEKINIQAIGRQFAMYAPMLANLGGGAGAHSSASVTAAAAAMNGHVAPLGAEGGESDMSGTNSAAMDKFLAQLEMMKQQALASQNSQMSQQQFHQLMMMQQQKLLAGAVTPNVATNSQTSNLMAAYAASAQATSSPAAILPNSSSADTLPAPKPVRHEDSAALIEGLMAQSRLALSNPDVRKNFSKCSFQFVIEGVSKEEKKSEESGSALDDEIKYLMFFIDGDSGSVGEGQLENAKTSIRLHVKDLVLLMNTTLSPFTAYQMGKIKISGDFAALRVLPLILQCTA